MAATEPEQLKLRLAEQTGLDASLLDGPTLRSYIERRCQELGLADDTAYHALIARDTNELERLVQEVSVAETWFFRYPASFQLLHDHAGLLLRSGSERLNMLSIACATGEEPYGMAMAAAAAGWRLDRLNIVAIDRAETSLAIARQACYRRNSFRDVTPDWAEQWFHRDDQGTKINPAIVAAVKFFRDDILNLASTVGPTAYDVVFCRNLFIYLGDDARNKLVNLLATLLSGHGMLFVGHAEFAILPGERFETSGVKHAFALRPRKTQPVREKLTRVTHPSATKTAPPRAKPVAAAKRSKTAAAPPVVEPAGDSSPVTPATLQEARSLADSGQLGAAVDVLEGLASSGAQDPDMFELLGSIHLSQGRLEPARECFGKALYFTPGHESALLAMAIVCDRLGDAEQAVRYRRRAARAYDENSNPPREKR